MAEIIDFPAFDPEEDIYAMDKAELEAYLRRVKARIAALDEREPADMESEEYEDWGEAHEALEDLADEILDRLDEM